MKKLKLFAAIALMAFASSCTVDDDPIEPNENQTGKLKLKIEHKWDRAGENLPFSLGNAYVQPITGDSLTFTKIKYYISNLQLQDAAGKWWKQDESYFLLDLVGTGEYEMDFDNIPNGTYTHFKYTLGVDSFRNVDGAQEGVLSPSNGMFWSWNSGYIMLKAEGTSPKSDGPFSFHLGGFMGEYAVPVTHVVEFHHAPLTISSNALPQIHLSNSVDLLWQSGTSVADLNKTHMPGKVAFEMSQPFYNSFQLEHLHQ